MTPEDTAKRGGAAHTIYRWDLDKTYLSTDFDSFKGLMRAAFEKAADKRTFPGAQVLLRELCATGPKGVYILSGSPQQMRKVIEEKLALDGITYNGLVLKPSLNRLMRGRFRFLKDQVSYKLHALLSSRLSVGDVCDEIMFGDDAEADAFVYSLYADLCSGAVSLSVLAQILEASRAYDDDAAALLELARSLPKQDVARRIFIHLERVEPSNVFADFGRRVCAFHNYFQPAVVLLEDGLIGAEAVMRVGLELVRSHAFSPEALAVSYADLVRRKLVGERSRAALSQQLAVQKVGSVQTAEAITALSEALELHPPLENPNPPGVEQPLDYMALLPSDKARATLAKLRARARPRF